MMYIFAFGVSSKRKRMQNFHENAQTKIFVPTGGKSQSQQYFLSVPLLSILYDMNQGCGSGSAKFWIRSEKLKNKNRKNA